MEDCDDGLEMGVPPAYYDTWNRHNSIAFCNYKGLRNAPGENNCFLNSAVQVGVDQLHDGPTASYSINIEPVKL